VRYLEEVEGGFLESGQGAAADKDVGVDREFFVVNLDGGKLDADTSRRVWRRLRKHSLSF
jgi:hypothetical protein